MTTAASAPTSTTAPTPNLYQLQGPHLHLTYATSGIDGKRILSKSRGLGRREGHGGVGLSHALDDEVSQGGHPVGTGETVMQIVGDVDAELGRGLGDGAEDVPRRDARL